MCLQGNGLLEENVLYGLESVSSSQLLDEWKMDEILFKVKKPKVKLELNRKKNRDFVLAVLLWLPTATFSPGPGDEQALKDYF